jgi:hypothetical protein
VKSRQPLSAILPEIDQEDCDGVRHVHGLRRVYRDVDSAQADYDLVKDLHTNAGTDRRI